MCLSEIHISMCLWENIEKRNVLSLSLELVKVGGYGFPHPYGTVTSFPSGLQ
jgi:hypothetical protein